jgi:DNA-binding transcriptional regulator PaaX
MNIKIDTEDTRQILESYLRNPEGAFTYKDLRKIMAETSETQIRGALFRLERSGILEVDSVRGRPKGGEAHDGILRL